MLKLKTLAAVGAASVFWIGTAWADLPQTGDDCFKAADEIADAVEQVELSQEEADHADDLLGRIEDHCEAGEFAQATELAESLRVLIADRR